MVYSDQVRAHIEAIQKKLEIVNGTIVGWIFNRIATLNSAVSNPNQDSFCRLMTFYRQSGQAVHFEQKVLKPYLLFRKLPDYLHEEATSSSSETLLDKLRSYIRPLTATLINDKSLTPLHAHTSSAPNVKLPLSPANEGGSAFDAALLSPEGTGDNALVSSLVSPTSAQASREEAERRKKIHMQAIRYGFFVRNIRSAFNNIHAYTESLIDATGGVPELTDISILVLLFEHWKTPNKLIWTGLKKIVDYYIVNYPASQTKEPFYILMLQVSELLKVFKEFHLLQQTLGAVVLQEDFIPKLEGALNAVAQIIKYENPNALASLPQEIDCFIETTALFQKRLKRWIKEDLDFKVLNEQKDNILLLEQKFSTLLIQLTPLINSPDIALNKRLKDKVYVNLDAMQKAILDSIYKELYDHPLAPDKDSLNHQEQKAFEEEQRKKAEDILCNPDFWMQLYQAATAQDPSLKDESITQQILHFVSLITEGENAKILLQHYSHDAAILAGNEAGFVNNRGFIGKVFGHAIAQVLAEINDNPAEEVLIIRPRSTLNFLVQAIRIYGPGADVDALKTTVIMALGAINGAMVGLRECLMQRVSFLETQQRQAIEENLNDIDSLYQTVMQELTREVDFTRVHTLQPS